MSVRQRTYTSRRKVWIADVRVGFRRKRGNFCSHRDAKLAEAKWRQELEAGSYQQQKLPTFEQWIEILISEHVQNGVRRDADRTESILRKFIVEFGPKRLDKISSNEIQSYLSRLKRCGYNRKPQSGATNNRYRSWLYWVFSWAIKREVLVRNPVVAVPRFPELPRVRWLEPNEIVALLDACDPLLKPLVLLAINTGARRGELLALNWADVDFNRDEIMIRSENSKSGDMRLIPLTIDARKSLLSLSKNGRRDGPVFSRQDRERWSRFPKERWAKALKESGIADAKEPRLANFRFHDLRHTAGTKLLESGVDVSVVSALLGHSTVAFTAKYYAHATIKVKRKAIRMYEETLRISEP